MRLTKPLILLFLLWLGSFALSNAADRSSADSFGDLNKIRERGSLRIGILNFEAPPFVFVRDGVLTGYDVETCRNMAHALGIEAVFVKIPGSYDDVIQAVADGRVDIGMSELSKTPSRSRKVYYSHSYFNSRAVFVVGRHSLAKAKRHMEDELAATTAASLRYFNDPEYKVATLANSTLVAMANEKFPQAQISPLTTWEEIVFGIYRGDFDLGLMGGPAFVNMLRKHPELAYKTTKLDFEAIDRVAIAVSPQLPNLVRWINDYLELHSLDDKNDIGALFETYFGAGFEPKAEPASADSDSALTDNRMGLIGGIHVGVLVLLWGTVIRKKNGGHWLLSPWSIFAAMFLGGLTGFYLPHYSSFFSKLAAIYMGFWQLCVLPIMICVMITSVYRLLANGDNSILVKRLLLFVPIILLCLALIGVVIGAVGQPGDNFSAESQQMLVENSGASMQSAEPQGVIDQVVQMVDNIVPDNVLVPIVEDQSLSILFIAVFFGITLGRVGERGGAVADILETVLDVFTRMIKASLYLLPFGLYALSLDFMANMGLELLFALVRLTVCMSLSFIPVLVFVVLVLKHRLGLSVKQLFQQFGPLALLAFSARSSVISMPLGLEAMGRCRQIDKNQAMAAFPFALLICHAPMALFYSITPVFIGQVFSVEFTLGQYLTIAILAILCTLAATGSIGLAYVLLLSIVCTPLGLPLEPAVLAGIAVVSIIDPLMSAVQALFGCGVTSILVEKVELSGSAE